MTTIKLVVKILNAHKSKSRNKYSQDEDRVQRAVFLPDSNLLEAIKMKKQEHAMRGRLMLTERNSVEAKTYTSSAKRAALQVLEMRSMVENIKTILELKSWVKGSEGLQDLLRVLVEEKTHLTLEELEPFTSQVYSEMLSHRLPCPALRRGAMWNGCTIHCP